MSSQTQSRPVADLESVRRARSKQVVRGDLPRSTALIAWTVGTLSALALWTVLYPLVIGGLQEADSQQRLFASLRRELSQATAPLGPVQPGRPVALLDIPATGLRGVVVVEGTASRELKTGPGHRRDTVLPGQVGTSVLLGRLATFGGPFGHLSALHARDVITLTTGQGAFRYVVDGVRRPGDPLPSPRRAGTSRLVLGTAEGSGWRSGLAPTSVVYVDATLSGKAVPAPTSRLAAVPKAEQPMGRSTSSLISLVFWLQALLLVLFGAVWLRSRWGHWQSWAVSFPVLLAVIIGTSGAASELLPNLL